MAQSLRPPNRAPSMGMVVLVSAVTSAVVSAAIMLGAGVGNSMLAGDAVEVPDLSGMSRDAASTLLSTQELRLVVGGEQHDPDIPPEAICQQQPRPGSQLRPGDAVTVHVSLGPRQIAVPDVSGQPVARARERLEHADLRVGEIERTGSGTPDTVVSTDPPAGEEVPPDTRVRVIAVPEQVTVAVPDVTGQSIRAAREAIEEAGFTVGQVRQRFDDMRPPFIILSQEPEGGTQADPGTEVLLVMNEE